MTKLQTKLSWLLFMAHGVVLGLIYFLFVHCVSKTTPMLHTVTSKHINRF